MVGFGDRCAKPEIAEWMWEAIPRGGAPQKWHDPIHGHVNVPTALSDFTKPEFFGRTPGWRSVGPGKLGFPGTRRISPPA
jgi:hypothetical protein